MFGYENVQIRKTFGRFILRRISVKGPFLQNVPDLRVAPSALGDADSYPTEEHNFFSNKISQAFIPVDKNK